MKPEFIPVLLGFATFLGTLAIVVTGFLFNNSRISDINSRITDLRTHVDTRINDLRHHFDERLDRLEEVFDARLTRIEEHLNLK